MSQQPISRSPDLKRLRDEGYQIEIRSGHLLMSGVPYVNARREVSRGTLVSTLVLAGDVTRPPDTHIAHFIGDYPCNADGTEITKMQLRQPALSLGPGLTTKYSFSSKPSSGRYIDYYEKMVTYATIISSPAFHIDSSSPKTFAPVRAEETEAIFNYVDTASSRAGIAGMVQRFANDKIAIIGLGGTGSYVLDLIAKMPVKEIHLFDADRFLQHNAFRAPGAASFDQLSAIPYKVNYLRDIYAAMHREITAHAVNIDDENVGLLKSMSFVFICVDGGAGKGVIVRALEDADISFIDTGIGVELVEQQLLGMVRVTTSTPQKRDHLRDRVSFSDPTGDAAYRSNIQIADLNALNASLAVIRWKKLRGLYIDLDREHHTSYVISGNTMINDEKT